MYCKKCGQKINEKYQFCEFCGFNQEEDLKLLGGKSKDKDDDVLISWYQLDRQYQKNLKSEFKGIYPPNAGLEVLAVICYIGGFFTALVCAGSYSIKVLDETISSRTIISVPMLIITLFLFTAGTIIGYSSNYKFDRAFSQWLLTRNIIK